MTARKKQETYVALLRGINVGGKNVIKMTDLRNCFEDEGFLNIVTYIQSGNVVFSAAPVKRAVLTARVEGMLAAAFDYEASVILRSRKDMRGVVSNSPEGFGTRPKAYRYDVIFLKEPLTVKEALSNAPTKPGVDEAYAGTGVLYYSRLISRASQSRLSRIVSMPMYQSMTIRNWNTTTKLMQLMDGAAV